MAPRGGVAVPHALGDDPDAHQVVDVAELPVLQHHLLVDTPEVFGAAGHLGADAQFEEASLHGDQELRQVEVAFGILGGHEVIDLGVPLGVQGGERQVLQAALQFLHAEAVRQGGVDVEGLACHLLLLRRREGRQRAHVVEPVGQLDDEDPQVLGHGHQHLPQRGGLVALAGRELDAVQLGDAVDDLGHLGAEVRLDVGQGAVGVLDDVVQQGGGHAHVVEAEAGHDAGHAEGVLHERLARLAPLGAVGAGRPRVGPLDEVHLGIRVVRRVLRQQRRDRPGGRMAPPGLQPIPRGSGRRLAPGRGRLLGNPDAHAASLPSSRRLTSIASQSERRITRPTPDPAPDPGRHEPRGRGPGGRFATPCARAEGANGTPPPDRPPRTAKEGTPGAGRRSDFARRSRRRPPAAPTGPQRTARATCR